MHRLYLHFCSINYFVKTKLIKNNTNTENSWKIKSMHVFEVIKKQTIHFINRKKLILKNNGKPVLSCKFTGNEKKVGKFQTLTKTARGEGYRRKLCPERIMVLLSDTNPYVLMYISLKTHRYVYETEWMVHVKQALIFTFQRVCHLRGWQFRCLRSQKPITAVELMRHL